MPQLHSLQLHRSGTVQNPGYEDSRAAPIANPVYEEAGAMQHAHNADASALRRSSSMQQTISEEESVQEDGYLDVAAE